MRTLGGDVKYAAGSEVRLMASTTYSDECVLLAQGRKGNEYLQCDPRLHQLTRKVTADAEGKFEFPNVSAGRYYVETQVYWTVPSQGLLFQNQGGPIGAYVDIRESETTKIILSR